MILFELTEQQKNCQHEWVYAGYILCSFPPKYPKICRKCGLRLIESNSSYVNEIGEYDKLVEKFGKENDKK